MEETLGKRIVAHRKRLGMTQDRLAEALGVTAQAVSKWENDQSCPDITMLPKLAEVFSVTTDELLGLEKKEVHIAEVVTQPENGEEEPDGLHINNGTWEFKWDGGRKSGVGAAVWLLLAGSVLFAANIRHWDISFFHVLWSSGMMVFGLFGLYPKLSVFRLGCALLGGYFLYIEVFSHTFETEYILPVFLLLFGLSLLIDALRRPKHGRFNISHNGKPLGDSSKNHCDYDGEYFDCATNFGENHYNIQLPRISGGRADVSFGEMTVDLTGCEEVADGCQIDLNCSFGQLEVLIPRKYRAVPVSSTAFAAVETKGSPGAGAEVSIALNCNASFGEISIRYI